MTLPNLKQIFTIITITLAISMLVSFSFPVQVSATLESDLEEIQKRLEEIEAERQQIENFKNSEKNKQSNLQNEIQLLTLDIKGKENDIKKVEAELEKLDIQIKQLRKRIKETEEEIIIAESEINELEIETDKRLVSMYMDQKSFTQLNLVFQANATSLIKLELYQSTLQEETNQLLEELEAKKIQLNKKRQQLDEDRVAVERDEIQVKESKVALERDRTNLASQKEIMNRKLQESQNAVYAYAYSLELLSEEQKNAEEKQEAIIAQLLARDELANGVPVNKGMFLGYEGNTGYSYGAHLHFMVYDGGALKNPCSYLPAGAYPTDWAGNSINCGGNGKVGIPLSPKGIFTSGFQTPDRPTHNAIDISTGGGGGVMSAHNGYVYYGYEPCPSWAPVCNGPAIWAKVCEVNGCSTGLRTLYYHLACTAEPASSPRSCQ